MTMSSTTAAPAPLTRDEAGGLLGQTMGLVAVTAGFFALGAYVGRDISGGWAIVSFIVAFAVLLGMNAAAKRSEQLASGLLFGFGVLLGLAVAPTVADYAGAAGLVIFAGLTAFDFQRLPHPGHPYRAAARRVDLPRRPQRLPPIPVDLRRRRVTRPGRNVDR
jgi:FtsH-binding integral membrane protein